MKPVQVRDVQKAWCGFVFSQHKQHDALSLALDSWKCCSDARKKRGIGNPDLGVVFAVSAAAVANSALPAPLSLGSSITHFWPVHLTGNESISSKAGLLRLGIIFQTLSEPKVSCLTLGINIFQKSMPIISEFYEGRLYATELHAWV